MTNSRHLPATLHDRILKLVILAFLSALGYVLMMLGKVIPYGPLSFLEVEPSDSVVLVAYALYGFFPSALVALLKTLLTMLTFGPVGAPIPIGQITALITSLSYTFGLLVLDKLFHAFSHGLGIRVLAYVLISLFVASLMTYLNYLFITPTFMAYGTEFLTVYDFQNRADLSGAFQQYFGVFNASYAGAIVLAYFPFNLLKATIVFTLYEIVANRVIFVILKSGLLKTTIFLKKDDATEKALKPFDSLLLVARKNEALAARKKQLEIRKAEKIRQKACRKTSRNQQSGEAFCVPIVKTIYVYLIPEETGQKTVSSDVNPEAFLKNLPASSPTFSPELLSDVVLTPESEKQEDAVFFAAYHADSVHRLTYKLTPKK